MSLHEPRSRSFASDNYAGFHPEMLAALIDADGGHQAAYGEDAYTARLVEVLSEHFGRDVEVFPMLTGTGSNVVALSSMLPRWGAAVTARTAHLNTDEGGAPEQVAGIKLYPVESPDGRLTPEHLAQEAWGYGFEHRAQPLAVSLTQVTELGTCYTPDQVGAIAELAHSRGMRVHMDGARIANAAAHLDVPLRAFTSDVGVDVVSLGGTKNGALGAEAIVVLEPGLFDGVKYLRKSYMQLGSKMRFISAQLLALFDGDLWLQSAQHANAMATMLADRVTELPGVRVDQPVESNAVFVTLPEGVADRLRERFAFYDWNAETGQVRWMCAFDTSPSDIDEFVTALRDALG